MSKMTRVKSSLYVTPASMVALIVSLAHHVRPQPSGPRIRSNSPWHIALSDVFFPSPFAVDDGSEYIGYYDETLPWTHMVCVSVQKETGEIELKTLLENIKFAA